MEASPDWANATPRAPSTGPSTVARPPIATPMRNAMEGATPTSAGEMMPTIGTNSAPAMPASTAARTYTAVLRAAGS